MKSILVIGMGRFGKHIAMTFIKLGHQVLAVDMSEEAANEVMAHVPNIQIGDCTKENILQSLGVSNFDICVVAVSSNLGTSLEITYQLKQLGAPYVISRVAREKHGKFLLNNGADEIIYPEKQVADRLAMRHSTSRVLDYIEVMTGYSISEVTLPEKWVGHTVEQVGMRANHNLNILVVKLNGKAIEVSPSHVFAEGEHLIIFGKKDDIIKFSYKF